MNGPLVIIVAHPDDEMIGAGAQLTGWRNQVAFIHVTDGAPRDLRDATAYGFSSREDYARARRTELKLALRVAGLQSAPLCFLDIADQEASWDLAGLAFRLMTHLERLQARAVLTHPYEGGHPDHDATAFGVQLACGLLRHKSACVPQQFEMTSYHAQCGNLITGEFLPGTGSPATMVRLTPAQRAFKKQLLCCFKTQHAVLSAFRLDSESFRPAPTYDFTQPPHAGPLYYERFDWGMTGAEWCRYATKALSHLGSEVERAASTERCDSSPTEMRDPRNVLFLSEDCCSADRHLRDP